MFGFEVLQEKYSKIKYDFYLKTKNFGDKSNTCLLTWMFQEHKKMLKLKHRDSDKCVCFSLKKHLLCPDCTLRAGNPRVWGLAAQPLLHRGNRNFSSSIHPPENHPFSILLVLRSITAHLRLPSKGHCWASLAAPARNAGDPGLIPELERPAEEGNGHPLYWVFLPGESMDRGTWPATVQGITVGYDWVTNHPRVIDSGWTISLICPFCCVYSNDTPSLRTRRPLEALMRKHIWLWVPCGSRRPAQLCHPSTDT